jgi:hypothetical protein
VVVLRQQQNQPWPSTITTASRPATLQSGITITNAIGPTTSPDGGFTVSSKPCHRGVGFFEQSIQQTLPTSTWPARPSIFHRHQRFSRFCLLHLISIAAVWAFTFNSINAWDWGPQRRRAESSVDALSRRGVARGEIAAVPRVAKV